MRKLLTIIILLGILILTYTYKTEIVNIIIENVIKKTEVNFSYKNSYYLTYNYNYIKNVDNFTLKDKNDLLNLYFTIINSGVSNFEFYCPNEYENCIKDVIDLANEQEELSNINGFVHPFNSFDTIETAYDTLGRVKLKIIKTYTDVEINELSKKVNEIIINEVKDEQDPKKIIKIIHDYIINNTKYDKDRTDNNIIKYASNTAYGVLFEGYGICSGYADAMALFLNHYKIPNFKVASENHVWNAVYIEDNWYHLDLTWDDPILDNGEDALYYDYFLITTEQLEKLDKTQHLFNKKVFSELAY